MVDILDPMWIFWFCMASFVAFLIASTLGIGGPLILMPVLMLQFSPVESVALIVPAMFLNNGGRLILYFRHIQWRPALVMLLSALPFAIVGATLAGRVPPKVIKSAIVLIIAYMLGSKYIFSIHLKVSLRAIFFWGIPTGFISGLSGTAGPPMAISLKGYGLLLKRFVATTALIQAALQLVRFPVYYATHILTPAHLKIAILIALSSIPSLLLSKMILARMNPIVFRTALEVLLGIIGLIILYNLIRPT